MNFSWHRKLSSDSSSGASSKASDTTWVIVSNPLPRIGINSSQCFKKSSTSCMRIKSFSLASSTCFVDSISIFCVYLSEWGLGNAKIYFNIVPAINSCVTFHSPRRFHIFFLIYSIFTNRIPQLLYTVMATRELWVG